MSPDDTTPPENATTLADPGPCASTEPAPSGERCMFIKLPLRADVPLDVSSDADQIEGLCAILKLAAQDYIRDDANKGEIIFDAEGVQVAYDDGTSTSFVAFPAADLQ